MLLTELASVWVVSVFTEGFSEVRVITEEVCEGVSEVCATCVITEEVRIIAEGFSKVISCTQRHIYILLHHAHPERGIKKEIAAIYLDSLKF